MRVRWACIVVAICVLLAIMPAASACSCAGGGDPRLALRHADGAFIGRSLGRVVPTPEPSPTPTPEIIDSGAPIEVRFDVEEDFKDNLEEEIVVRTSGSGASCGFSAPAGRRVAMYLTRHKGRWTSGLCAQTDPATLRKAAQPLPPPDGVAPPRFLLGGSFGGARTFSLDAQGRTLRYAKADGYTSAMSVCPGADVFAELVTGVVDGRWWKLAIAVRDADTLKLRREHRFTAFERTKGYESAHAGAIVCLDRRGDTVAVFGQNSSGTVGKVVLTEREGERRVFEGRITATDLGEDRWFIVQGTALRELDPRTGRVSHLGTVPPGTLVVDVSPDARHAVLSATGDDDDSKRGHYLLDVGGRRLTRLRTKLGSYTWVDARTFAAFGTEQLVRVFDVRLRKVAQWKGWRHEGRPVVAAGVAYAVWYGDLTSAPVSTGPMRTLRAFDFEQNFVLEVLDAPRGTVLTTPSDPTHPTAPSGRRSGPVLPVAIALSALALGSAAFVWRRRSV